jgi:hypothetical protein
MEENTKKKHEVLLKSYMEASTNAVYQYTKELQTLCAPLTPVQFISRRWCPSTIGRSTVERLWHSSRQATSSSNSRGSTTPLLKSTSQEVIGSEAG